MISSQDRISTIIAHNPLLELVLDRFELTYRHRGEQLEVVCKDKCTNVDFFVEILRVFDEPQTFDAQVFMHYDLTVILDYLQKTHRYYLHKRIGELERSIDQVMMNVGSKHTILKLLVHFFAKYKQHLLTHIQLEEEVIFPYIKKLINQEEISAENRVSLAGFMHNHEDDQMYNQLCQIRELIIQKKPDVCQLMSFRVLMSQLEAFERDLHIHERIEEEILMPKAMELELD